MNQSTLVMHRLLRPSLWATCAACAWCFACEVATAQYLSTSEANTYALLQPVDVELDVNGTLCGRLLWRELGALPCPEIALHDATGQLAVTNVDHDGSFSFHGLSGGVYQLVIGDDCRLVRVWAKGTAPPSSAQEFVVDIRDITVRGQFQAPPFLNTMARRIKYGATKPLVVGSVLAVAVGVPVIVHNIEQDDQS